jgi:hypothetical protein
MAIVNQETTSLLHLLIRYMSCSLFQNRSSPGVRCRRPQRLTSVIARTAPALIRLNQRRCNLEKPHFITFKSRSSTSREWLCFIVNIIFVCSTWR